MSDYPNYSRAERIADASMHGASIGFAVTGAVMLYVWAGATNPDLQMAAGIYGAALVACFTASAVYHFSPSEAWRPVFRRVDHAFIYLKIAGTYTPLVVILGTSFAYGVLGVVWAMAVLGMVMKLAFWQTPGKWSTLLPLLMGWMSIALIWPLAKSAPGAMIALMVAGGLTYTVGAAIYSAKDLKFSMALWHAFVLAASVCFYQAIVMGLDTGQAAAKEIAHAEIAP